MLAKEIAKNVYWVGARDWNVRDFHGYVTPRGTTDNAYLIIDEKITLIDTVKAGFEEEMIRRISSIINPSQIDYVISNHVEMDHSGGIPKILEVAKNAQLITCPVGKLGLEKHFGLNFPFKVVKTLDTLSLGQKTLQFVQTPLVHWPDSMATFLVEDQILFSNDAFGHHMAPEHLFDDQMPLDILMEESAKYYANIVLPYGPQVEKVFESLGKINFKTICPSHGIVWRKHVPEILEKYRSWLSHEDNGSAVIVYDSMWKSTEALAMETSMEFERRGIPVKLRNLKYTHMSDIMTDVMLAKYVAVGTPILNNMIFPSVAGFLTYMRGLKPQNKIGFIFGSFGWNQGAFKEMFQWFEDLGWKMPVQPFTEKWVPTADEKKALVKQMEALF